MHGFLRGDSAETISQNFPVLRLEEVYGAIAYYLAHQDVVDEYLLRQEQKWEEARRTAAPLPTELRKRLERARHCRPASLAECMGGELK